MTLRISVPCLKYCLSLVLSLPLSGEWAALGPFGGHVAFVATTPASPGHVLAGTRGALLFESSDGGESWIPLAFPAQLRAVLHALVLDPRRPGVYFAGVSSESPQFTGILRTEDGGATWHQVPDLRGTEVRAITVFRGDSRILAAGTESGVFGSRDGGVTWSRLSPPDNRQLQPIVAVAFDPKHSGTLYAGTPHLPWKTEDGGTTWRSAHTGVLDDSDIFSLQVDRNRPQRVFAAACSGIYCSLNAGDRWARPAGVADAARRTYTIVQDPQHENVWFAGTSSGLIRTLDGGATWNKLATFKPRSIAFDWGRLGRLFVATDTGILRSDDSGRSWQEINRGFSSVRLTFLTEIDGVLFTTVAGQAEDGGVSACPPMATSGKRPSAPICHQSSPFQRLNSTFTISRPNRLPSPATEHSTHSLLRRSGPCYSRPIWDCEFPKMAVPRGVLSKGNLAEIRFRRSAGILSGRPFALPLSMETSLPVWIEGTPGPKSRRMRGR